MFNTSIAVTTGFTVSFTHSEWKSQKRFYSSHHQKKMIQLVHYTVRSDIFILKSYQLHRNRRKHVADSYVRRKVCDKADKNNDK